MVTSVRQRFDRFVVPEPMSGCHLWLGATRGNNNYGTLSVDGRHTLAHRVAWELEHGSIPDELRVLHRCDVPICVNPAHLFLGTQSDNMADRTLKGRGVKGEEVHTAKMTPESVLALRALCASGATPTAAAPLFGITPRQAADIVRRRYWRHVA